MLRNRYNPNGMGYAEPPMMPTPPISRLDAKDERLVEQSEDIGYLKGQNELLDEDNRRLEQTVKDLEERNRQLQDRNTELEKRESAAQAGYKTGSQLVEEIESALKSRKETK